MKAQKNPLDSLLATVEKSEGKKKAHALTSICQYYWYKSPIKSIEYGKQAVEIAKKTGDRSQYSSSENSLGYAYSLYGDYPSALELMLSSITITEELRDSTENLLNESALDTAKSNKTKKALTLYKRGIANISNNIGTVYTKQKNYPLALKYLTKFLDYAKENNHKQAEAEASTNIGVVYQRIGKFEKALELHQVYEDYGKSIDNDLVISIAKGNKGEVYQEMGNNQKAKEMYEDARTISLKIADTEGILLTSISLSSILMEEGKATEAISLSKEAVEIAKKNNFLSYEQEAYQLLSEVYRKQKKFDKALEYYDSYVQMKDSIFNDESANKIARLQNSYEMEKKELAVALQQNEIEILNKNKKIQQIVILAVSCGLLLTLLLGGGLWKTFRKTRKQRDEISLKNTNLEQYKEEILAQREAIQAQNGQLELTNNELGIKNQRITDSINYAKRIQNAILPSANRISQTSVFAEHFVLFKPKDIVSGDFYWLSEVDGKIILAISDCTGHGVSGALMSMIGNDLLNEIVHSRKIYQPTEILKELDNAIRFTLHQDEQATQDGMDIAICTIDLDNQSLTYAGAKSPLTYCQNNQMVTIKGTRRAIGGYVKNQEKSFEEHVIPLKEAQKFYLFSDGFQDQFGDKSKKKFLRKQLIELITANSAKPMREQREILETTLQNWMGKEQQTDDILVFGFSISS